MNLRNVALCLCAVLAFAASARAQGESQMASPGAARPVETPEPVDDSFVPHVESKTEAFELQGVVRDAHYLRIRLKNVSGKSIYAFRMSYHRSGTAVLFCFLMADKRTAIAPGEVYKYDHAFIPTSILAREPLVFEAVIFEDGTGDGDAKKVKSLHDLFLTNRRELEHVTAAVQQAAESPSVEAPDSLRKLLRTLSATPNYTYGVPLEGLTGLMLPAWKETAMRLVQDLDLKRSEGREVNVREELIRIKDEFVKTMGKYPGAT